MASADVNVRIADLPAMKQFIDATAGLLRALGECRDLPEPVMAAAGQVRLAVAALGGKDIGAPPGAVSEEDRIREAMAEAQEHPGRTVTR